MAQALSQHDEERLLDGLKQAVDLVDNHGMEPNAALTKVAKDNGYQPGFIHVACAAYNTGRQNAQWKANQGILDKMASFPLADANQVVANCFPTSKAASARPTQTIDPEYRQKVPSWVHGPRSKQGEVPTPPAVKKASVIPVAQPAPVLDPLGRAFSTIGRAEKTADDARMKDINAEDDLRFKMACLVDYFKKDAYSRLPFGTFEHLINIYEPGPSAQALLDLVHHQSRCQDKRASAVPVPAGAFNRQAQPFGYFRDCIKQAVALHAIRADAAQLTKKAADDKEEHLRPFGYRSPRSPSPPPPSASGPVFSVKRAIIGSEVGSIFAGDVLANMVGTPGGKAIADPSEDALLALEDPAHQNELRRIRTQSMLNRMMTDPNDPIHGADPTEVLNRYNEIARAAPRLAEQPALLGPALRRALQSHMDTFEARELLGAERDIAQSRSLPPSAGAPIAAPVAR